MRHHRLSLKTTSTIPNASLLAAGLLVLFGGCTTSSSDLTESQKQDQIMTHPMDYKPEVGGNISGGDTNNFDQNSFNHDVHSFWDP